jgi:arsenate reductase (thioredoxin)
MLRTRPSSMRGRGSHRHHRRTAKILAAEAVQPSEVVIALGYGDTGPYYPEERDKDWVWRTPPAKTSRTSGPYRDQIRRRVEALIDDFLPV